MALFYREVQSTMPDKDGKKRWHPVLVKTGMFADTQKLGKLIAQRTTIHPGDVHNVIRCLTEVMNEQLMNSNSVRLDGFGTFTLKSRSKGKGVDKAEDVSPNQMTGLHCQFTPEYTRKAFEGTTRALYEGAQFLHVSKLNKHAAGSSDTGNDGNDDEPIIDPNA